MGFFKKLLGIEDYTSPSFQRYMDDEYDSYQTLEEKQAIFKDILFNQAPSKEEFMKKVKEKEEKEKAKYKSPYLEKYEQFMNEAKKHGYDHELMKTIHQGPSLFDVKKLDRISRLERSFIEHTGFNKDAFPANTELFYLDDIFSEIYTAETYQNKKEFFGQYLDEYLHKKDVEKCCIKLGQEDFLYAYKNNIEADAVEYNFLLVDKNNNVKDKIIYEENGRTVNNFEKLLAILQMEVEYLDLAHKKEFKDIGDINPEIYTNPNLPYSDRIYIKNQILIDLYESRKYDDDSLDIFRDCLERNKDIGYILNPSYTAEQRSIVLKIVEDYKNNPTILKNLRDFSVKYGTHFDKRFSHNQFGYVLECVQNNDIEKFNEPEKLAQMDLEGYKDFALHSTTNSYEITPENSNRAFVIYKDNEKYPEYDEFRLEEIEFDENGKKIGQFLVYEKRDGKETPVDGLNSFLAECEKAHIDQDSLTFFNNVIKEVSETISDVNKHGHVHFIYTEDSSTIQIEGIRSEKKELTEEDQMAIFLGGQQNANTIDEETAGIVISLIKDNEIKVLYSDAKNADAMFETKDEALSYILNEHGSFTNKHDVRNMPISLNKNNTLSENIEKEKNLLYKEKYKSISQKKLEQMMNFAMKKKKHSILSSQDDKVSLLFEPYSKKDAEGNMYNNCNIYKIEDGEKTPLYVRNLDEKGMEHITGDIEDALNVLLDNDFALQDTNDEIARRLAR